MTDHSLQDQGSALLEDLALYAIQSSQDRRTFGREELDGVLESVERSWNFTRSGELSELQRVLSYIRELHDSLPLELRPEPPDTLTIGVNELGLFFSAALRGVRDADEARTLAGRLLEISLDHGGHLRTDGVLKIERRSLLVAFDLLLSHDCSEEETLRSALLPLRERFSGVPRAAAGD